MVFSQVMVIIIFVAMFIAITTGKVSRYIPALIGGALTILVVLLLIERNPQSVTAVLNLQQIGQSVFWVPGDEHLVSRGINWQTIFFIAGMMVMVEGLGEVGFFRWICLFVARLMKYRVVPILVAFMLLSGFLAMFIDSITVLLFLATITIQLARMIKFDPVPIIIAEIFAANVGGAATMSGDPPNIIIGTALGYTFLDFLRNTGVIAWIGMVIAMLYFYLLLRKALVRSHESAGPEAEHHPDPREAISSPGLFFIHVAIFIFVVVLLITHAMTGISVALIGFIAAGLTMLAAVKKLPLIFKRLDWQTLLFFIGLFICVGGLEETGVLRALAELIGDATGQNVFIVITIILWISAFASAIVDNIPFAATMVPVIQSISVTTGIDLHTQAWALALGTDIGGNATPIGASANVVGTAIAEKEGYKIGWGRYCKYALPAMVLVVGACWLYLTIVYA